MVIVLGDSHKTNPLVRTTESHASVPWITWEAVTGVEGTPVESCYDTRWLTRRLSIQAKVEGIVLKAARS
jgi:hypothetical protein